MKSKSSQRKGEYFDPSQIHNQLKLVTEIGKQISSINDIDELCFTIVGLVQNFLNYDFVAIWIVETSGNSIAFKAASSVSNYSIANKHLEPDAKDNYVVLAWQTAQNCLRIPSNDEDSEEHPPKTALAIPILYLNDTIAVLEIHQYRDAYFDNEEAYLLEILVNQISAAIRNASLFKELETTKELEVLTLRASQTAISLENSRLYADLRAQGKKLQATNRSLEREMAERQKAEESYRSIFENAVEGIFRSTLTGKIVSANPGLARMLGYSSPDELIETVTDVSKQLYKEPKNRSEFIRQLVEHGSVQDFETEVYRKDGELIWISINAHSIADGDGQIIYIEGISFDITERKRAEKALRQSERRFATTFQISPIAITISHIKDRRYIDVNDSYLALHGYSREEVLKGKVRTNSIWADPEQRASYERLREEHGAVRQFEFNFLNKSGEIGTGLLSSERIDLDGEVYSIAFTLDITERKKAEQQQLELALANEKVQALTEFLGNISHDLKTPLAVIKTCLYLLDKFKEPAKQQDQLRTIKEQTHSLEKYIQDILLISRLDYTRSLAMEELNLNSLIRKVERELRPSAEKNNIRTSLNLEEDLPFVLGDEDELHSAIVNLVENAFNYTPEGGSVSINTFASNCQVVVRISDTGIGINEAELPHIFERFYRASEAKESVKTGSGLGLAIVKRVIDLHRGTIKVKSNPGKGTCFELALPVT
jgi:PAS domain S-box-containing protein